MKKIVLMLLFIFLLNSCFLAVTGAPHEHYYKEINGKNDLKLSVVCYYLNKTFSFKNNGFEDSIYIKSSVFKKPTEKNYSIKLTVQILYIIMVGESVIGNTTRISKPI